jgi:hypothetical protein
MNLPNYTARISLRIDIISLTRPRNQEQLRGAKRLAVEASRLWASMSHVGGGPPLLEPAPNSSG